MRTLRPLSYGVVRAGMHLGALTPLAVLIFRFLRSDLTANPIQAATQATGDAALWLLTLSLACTPLYMLIRKSIVNRLRRPLGLYAFFYAALHVLLFTGIDYAFNLRQLADTFFEKRFLWVGAPAFIILLALAVTSFTYWIKRLGRTWKSLHRLVYLAALLAVAHNAWAVKGNLSTLQGDILQPFAFGILVVLLLAARLPGVRAALARRSAQPARRVIPGASSSAPSTVQPPDRG